MGRAHLGHLYAHVPHGLANLWQLDESIRELHDLGRLLERAGNLDHSCKTEAVRSTRTLRMRHTGAPSCCCSWLLIDPSLALLTDRRSICL